MNFLDEHITECRITKEFVVLCIKTGEKKILNPSPKMYLDKLEEILALHQPKTQSTTIDFSSTWGEIRVRGQLYHSNHGWNLVIRKFDSEILPLHRLGFSDPEKNVLSLVRGKNLTLFCGEMNSGKSTTLASACQAIASEDLRGECVTIENPVERLYDDPLVSQREVGVDVENFASGIRDAVRQNADTIVVGEIRSREEAHQAVEAGLIGIRVLATLHAGSVEEALSRMWAFLDDSHDDILLGSLQGIVVQHLIREHGHSKLFYESLQITEQVRAALFRGPQDLAGVKNLMYMQRRQRITEQVEEAVKKRLVSKNSAHRWLKS